MNNAEKFDLEVDLNGIKNIMKANALNRILPFILHDLNNKLAAISGYTELMTIEGKNSEPKKNDIEKILGITDETIEILARLKEITGYNNQPQTNNVFSIAVAVESVTRLMGRVFVKNKISVKTNEILADVHVNGDMIEFMYAALEILIYFVERIGETGCIYIRTDSTGDESVSVFFRGVKKNKTNKDVGLGKGVLSEKMTLLFLDKVLEGMGGCFEILQNNVEIVEYKLTLKTVQISKNKNFYDDFKLKCNTFENFNML